MATVNITLDKQKKDSYKANLTVNNNTSNTYSNWNITLQLPNGTSIERLKHFDITTNGNIATLTPEKSIATLKPSDEINDRLKGNGSVIPTLISFNSELTPQPSTGATGAGPSAPPSNVSFLYNMPMTDLTKIEDVATAGFNFQYSYDKQDGYTATKPNPAYFNITQPQGLEIGLYLGDKPFKQGNKTEPRTELRGLKVILDKVAYTLTFDRFNVDEPTFDFGFAQIFGDGFPNLILRWRSGGYQLLSAAGKKSITLFPGIKLSDDTGVWTNWKLEFMLDKSNGYTKVYRNNILLGETKTVNNSGGNNSYLKLGSYSQQMPPSNNIKAYIKNLMLYS